MNYTRRNILQRIVDDLNSLLTDIDMVKDEEQDAYDNMPEGLQYSERGETMQENIDTLESIYDDMQNIIDNIEEVIRN